MLDYDFTIVEFLLIAPLISIGILCCIEFICWVFTVKAAFQQQLIFNVAFFCSFCIFGFTFARFLHFLFWYHLFVIDSGGPGPSDWFYWTFYSFPLFSAFEHAFWCLYDPLSFFFILLTVFLIPLCLLYSGSIVYQKSSFFAILLFLLEFFLILVFGTQDLFVFYAAFEGVLIPMFLLIGIWGAHVRKIRANYLFFLYTFFGSIFLLVGILYLFCTFSTTWYYQLFQIEFSVTEQRWLWFAFFIGFAVKVPLVPFHIWLPEAHVEAPTAGSVLLAGVLLKMGTYGFLRFLIPLFPLGLSFFKPVIILLSLVGAVYISLLALRQQDLKRVIAYASIAHMNLLVFGIFSGNLIGFSGSVLQMLAHGFSSGGLFFLVGVLYSRHGTRLIKYYGGIAFIMPVFTMMFLLFIFANMGVPGTGNFVGEFLIFLGLFQSNPFSLVFTVALSVICCTIYSLWVFNQISFGICKAFVNQVGFTKIDANRTIKPVCNVLVAGSQEVYQRRAASFPKIDKGELPSVSGNLPNPPIPGIPGRRRRTITFTAPGGTITIPIPEGPLTIPIPGHPELPPIPGIFGIPGTPRNPGGNVVADEVLMHEAEAMGGLGAKGLQRFYFFPFRFFFSRLIGKLVLVFSKFLAGVGAVFRTKHAQVSPHMGFYSFRWCQVFFLFERRDLCFVEVLTLVGLLVPLIFFGFFPDVCLFAFQYPGPAFDELCDFYLSYLSYFEWTIFLEPSFLLDLPCLSCML